MHPRLRRRLRPIAVIVLAFFTWFSIEPWNYAQAAQDSSVPRASHASVSRPKAPTAAEVFETNLRSIKEQVRAARDGDAYQAQLAGLLKSLEQAVAQSSRDLESTRQAVDRLARAIEHGRPSQDAIKALHTQQQTVKATVGQVRLNASGIEGLLRGMALPASLAKDQKQAKDAVTGLMKTFNATLTAMTQRAEQQHGFDAQEHQAFLAATMDLDQGLATLQTRVEALAKEATPERRRAQLWEEAFSKRDSVLSADRAIRKEFAETEAFLKKKELPQEILDRHEAAVSDYEKNFSQLKGYFTGVDKAHRVFVSATERGNETAVQAAERDLESKLTAFDDFLKANVKDPPHQPLDPNNLPHRTPKPTERKPRLKKEEFAEFQPQIRLAYNGEPSNLMLAQAATDLPTPADLAETIEVQFTPEIQALAAELEHNPVKIYNWVHNNIDFVPTYGSIQGAHMCLLTKQCNDMDTASLLIALLRVSAIPARYASGTIEVLIEPFMNWVGGFADARAALIFVASAGTPVAAAAQGGQPGSARLEHFWVEAFVDYVPSGGVVQRDGDGWLALDGSFKSFTYKEGLDVQAITGFDAPQLVSDLAAASVINEETGSVSGIPELLIQQQIAASKTAIREYLENVIPDGTIGDIIGSKDIVKRTTSRLPANLPYRVLVESGPVSTLPDALRHSVSLKVADAFGTGPSASHSFYTSEVAAKRLTISYLPATQNDADTINVAGGFFLPAPYLVRLVPTIMLDGDVVAKGAAAQMGEAQRVSLEFSSPTSHSEYVSHQLVVSSFAVVGLDLQRVPKALIDRRVSALAEAADNLGIRDIPVHDLIGESLHLQALGYFQQLDAMSRIVSTGKVVHAKQPSELLFRWSPRVNNLFGVPFEINGSSMAIDVARYPVAVQARSGDATESMAFNLASGSWASALEHSIFEQTRNQTLEGVSTVKLLGHANQQGSELFRIDTGNVDVVLPLLQVSSRTVSDVRNAVSAGKFVLIAGQSAVFHDWSGDGYMVIDPETGAGAYLISGGLAGGEGAQKEDEQAAAFEFLLEAIAFTADVAEMTIDASYYVSKLIPRGVHALLTAIGHLTASVSAFSTAYDMYVNTGCAWKAGVAASVDFLISTLVGMAAGYLVWLVIGAALFTVVLAIAAVILAGIVAAAVTSLILSAVESIQYCFRILRRPLMLIASNFQPTFHYT